ncbi:MAG: O-methyltransferase [Clostridia bacterium]|nr:O-methyltransferase [Clostridia bacterium]
MKELEILEKFARENHIPVLLDDSAKFLAEFVNQKQFKNILEIGTAVGYSGSIMLLAGQQANLTTIELNAESYNKATKTFNGLGLGDRVKQLLGDAYEHICILNNENKKYDLIFLDGPKGQYLKYYPLLLNMLEPNGCLLADNVLFKGMVRSSQVVPHKKRAMVTKLRQFLKEIETRDDLQTTIHDIGDGIAEIYKKQ